LDHIAWATFESINGEGWCITFEYLRRQAINCLSSLVQMPIWKYVDEVID
jgi:hypothetical protein